MHATPFGAIAVLPSGSRTAKPSPNAAASGGGASGVASLTRSAKPEPNVPPEPDDGLIGAPPPPNPEAFDGIEGLYMPAVVDELRSELDGHAAAVAAPPSPAGLSTGAPVAPAGSTAPAGFTATPVSSPSGWGGFPGTASGGFAPAEADLSALPLPDPGQLGDGVAVTLPDGSSVTAPNAMAASAVRHALTQLGVPYVWGGTTPGVGLDCSGLTQWAYHEAGLNLPRLAQEQDVGAPVAIGDLRPGDLAVWDGHVAMIVGNGQMVEAGDPVQLSPIRTTNAGQGFQGFWRPTA